MPLKIAYLTAEGLTEVTHPDGTVETSTVAVPTEDMVSMLPTANVGLSLQFTKNLGNYQSLKVQVSLHVPTQSDEESWNKAFESCKVWCDKKLGDVLAEAEDESEV